YKIISRETKLTQLLNIKHPIIYASMFLVSNTSMVKEGMKSGITDCIPALNYTSEKRFSSGIPWAVMWLWLSPNCILKM
ncbi:MAG: nitronate monooxygenase, partial [Flavobacteriales bacterium]